MADAPSATPPAVAAPAATPAAPKPPETPDFIKAKLAEVEQNRKIVQGERAKFEQERAEFSKAQAKAQQDAEVARQDRLRNPAKYLEADYGPDWRKTLAEVAEKGSPPAELVASGLAEAEKRFAAQVADLRKEFEAKLADQQKAETERALKYGDEAAVQHVKGNPDAYPLINAWDGHASVPASIRQHFDETCEWGEDGKLVKAGEVWTPQQAAEDLEKKFKALWEKGNAVFSAKKEQPKAAAPTPLPGAPAPKAETPPASAGWSPVPDDRAAADRAWQAAVKARTPAPTTSQTAH